MNSRSRKEKFYQGYYELIKICSFLDFINDLPRKPYRFTTGAQVVCHWQKPFYGLLQSAVDSISIDPTHDRLVDVLSHDQIAKQGWHDAFWQNRKYKNEVISSTCKIHSLVALMDIAQRSFCSNSLVHPTHIFRVGPRKWAIDSKDSYRVLISDDYRFALLPIRESLVVVEAQRASRTSD